MNIESHPAMHYACILLFYNVGLALNVLAAAYITMTSHLNSVRSIKSYFALRWIPVTIRWVLCIFMFLILWANPSIVPLEKFMPNLSAHMGAAGVLGWFSDTLWDKVLAVVLPGIQKELPPITDGTDSTALRLGAKP